jgi:hypothetical protein
MWGNVGKESSPGGRDSDILAILWIMVHGLGIQEQSRGLLPSSSSRQVTVGCTGTIRITDARTIIEQSIE